VTTRPRALSAVLSLLVWIGASCGSQPDDRGDPRDRATARAAEPALHQDLRVGYQLLLEVLDDEAQLKWLKLLRKLTLRGPREPVALLMDRIAETSKQRAEELAELRALPPAVEGEAEQTSPVGDAINQVAADLGRREMIRGGDDFSLRFVLLQAQATRMVGAMATAIARFDPNTKRTDWLAALAKEYEAYREELIDLLQRMTDAGEAER